MTAETEVSEVYKGEIVEACDLDMSSYEDLQKGGGECNGVSHDSGEGVIGYGQGDSDCSYVFVSGRDVVSDDYAEKDLNVESLREPDHTKDEKQVQAGELRILNGENDQLHEAVDCCDVEGTVDSSSNNRYIPVESTGVLVLEGDLVQKPNAEVDMESEPRQVNAVIMEEQTSFESVAEDQTGLESGADEQTGLESGAEEQTGLESVAVEQAGLESGAEEQTGLESGAGEQTGLESGAGEQTGLESGPGQQTGLESGGEGQNGLESGAEGQNGLESGAEGQHGLESGGEGQNGLESGAEGQHGLECGVEGQHGLECGVEVQKGLECGAEVQNGLECGVEEQSGLESGAEEQTGLDSGEVEQTGLESGEVEQTGSESGAEEQTGLDTDAGFAGEQTGAETGLESIAEEQTDLGSGAEEQTGLDSGAEVQTGLNSSAEVHTGMDSGAEVHAGMDSGAEVQTSLDSGVEQTNEQTSMESGSEKTDPEPYKIVVEKAQSQTVVPVSDNENPIVDAHVNFKASEEIAESWEFPLTTECKLLHAKDREANDGESTAEITENQGYEVVIIDSDECDLHELDNVHGKVQGESESVSETVTDENQESEIKVSEELPFDKDGEKQASDLEDDLPLEMPSKEEAAVGSVLDENGDGLSVECSSSEIKAANDCHQPTSELYASSENRSLSDCVRSESLVGDVPAEKEESLSTGLDDGPMVEQEENGVSLITIGSFHPINSENVVSCPDDDTKPESEVENAHNVGDTILAFSGTDVRPKTIISFGSITFPYGDGNVESHATKLTPKISSHKPVNDDVQELIASELKDSVEIGSNLPTSAIAETKSESEVEKMSSVSYKDVVSKIKVLNGSAVNSRSIINGVTNAADLRIEGDQISTKDVDLENEGYQITSAASDDKLACQEALEFLNPDGLDSQNVPAEVGKRPFHFLIKVPRYDDDKIREEIKLAQLQVDEKTKSRDAIRSEIQIKRAVCKEYNEKFEAAVSEERAARELLKSKFQEIDSVQSVINRVKNAMSVKDIDCRIRHMEHAIEHETLPLKEEKQLIRDIKQLRNVREQLSSNMGRQEQVQQALEQKSQVEEQSKILREEVDSLRNKVQKAEVITKAAKKKSHDENGKMNELLTRFKAADKIRQEAYADLQSLRKKLSEKNQYFRMYKDVLKAANDYASAGDKEALQQLCLNEVETIMELWNNNDEFRKEYIRCNTRSTLRRLKTLDGRSLGPDEEPPVLPNSLHDIGRSFYAPTKDSSVPIVVSTVEQEKQMVSAEAERADNISRVKAANQKNQMEKKNNNTIPATEAVSATISGRDKIEETKEEEHKQTKEEEELTKRTEELRKEEEAAKLKEQRRLEEIVKAKEALERKKRNAEKAQARAELRAQKEAEQKQREREKAARKRERKKASSAEATHDFNEAEYAPCSDTPSESTLDSESIEKPRTIRKTPHKPSQFTKQTKSKSIPPPPIRNRGKRRIQSWMWVLLIVMVVLALFLLGNSGLSSSFGLQSFGF